MAKTLNALIYPSDPNVIVERRMIDMATVPKHKQAWWKPIVIVDAECDQSTQVKDGQVEEIGATEVVKRWKVRDKTTAEIDDEKEQRVPTADSAFFQVSIDQENRIRKLEGDKPISPEDYCARIKAMLP